MTKETINELTLNEYCKGIAQEIYDQCDGEPDECSELAWQYADGSEYVIYHYLAHQLCQNCNTEEGEHSLEDYGFAPKSYNEFASAIALCEIYTRINNEILEIHEMSLDYII